MTDGAQGYPGFTEPDPSSRPYEPGPAGQPGYQAPPAAGAPYQAQPGGAPYQAQPGGGAAPDGQAQYQLQPAPQAQYQYQAQPQWAAQGQPYPVTPVIAPKSPAIGVLLSFFIPGLGSLVNGSVAMGIIILAADLISWLLVFVLIGIPLVFCVWVWGMVDGYLSAQRWNRAHGIIS